MQPALRRRCCHAEAAAGSTAGVPPRLSVSLRKFNRVNRRPARTAAAHGDEWRELYAARKILPSRHGGACCGGPARPGPGSRCSARPAGRRAGAARGAAVGNLGRAARRRRDGSVEQLHANEIGFAKLLIRNILALYSLTDRRGGLCGGADGAAGGCAASAQHSACGHAGCRAGPAPARRHGSRVQSSRGYVCTHCRHRHRRAAGERHGLRYIARSAQQLRMDRARISKR